MSRIVFAGLLFCLSAPASALTPPQMINFQGKLINPATGNPQTGPVGLSFSLYNVPAGGTALYTESQTNVPLVNGVFSVVIGTQTGLSRELFLGASAYLGVTVTGDAAGELSPRAGLAMSASVFSANQLSDNTETRLVAGASYSTFSDAGNLAVPAGVSGSSGTFANEITASSGTFLGVGGSQYSVAASSGILMSAGTLRVDGEGGIGNSYGIVSGTGTFTAGLTALTASFTGNGGSVYSVTAASGVQINGGTLDVNAEGGITNSYGIQTGSVTWLASAQPAVSNAGQGLLYFDSTAKRLELSQDNGSWQVLLDTRTETQWIPIAYHPQITAAAAVGGATANKTNCVRFYMTENFLIERMGIEVVSKSNTTGDVGIYSDAGAKIVDMGGTSLNSLGLITKTGLSAFLQRGTMYRYCFCAASTTPTARSVSTTDVTNTLENVFTAAEGTAANNCAAGVLPATLGAITSASITPILAVIANSTGP